jgi:hypothetical protein
MVLYRSVKNAAVNASRLKFKWIMIEFWDGHHLDAYDTRYSANLQIVLLLFQTIY